MTNRNSRVKSSLALLRQVRVKLADDPTYSLAVTLDTVIEGLELYLDEEVENPSRIKELLNVLATGLAAIPAIRRFIELLKDQ